MTSVAPGLVPGGIYVRMATGSGQLLSEHPLEEIAVVGELAQADIDLARRWLLSRPADTIRVELFDGDDGRLVAALNVRADGPGLEFMPAP